MCWMKSILGRIMALPSKGEDASDAFLADFVSPPDKHVFLIDETRPFKQNGQFAVFGLVVFTAGDLVEAQHEWYVMATNPAHKPLLKSDIKGQHLYGSIPREDLQV